MVGHGGASQVQDGRYTDKMRKLKESMKFPTEFSTKVDMKKVNLEVMKPWIATRITELLGIEDEVLSEFVFSLLEPQYPDPKEMQIALTGFMEKKTPRFMFEMWKLLMDAQDSLTGIPSKFIQLKKEEILQQKISDEKVQSELRRIIPAPGSSSAAAAPASNMSEMERIKLDMEQRDLDRQNYRSRGGRNHPGRYDDRRRSRSRERDHGRSSYHRRSRSRSRDRYSGDNRVPFDYHERPRSPLPPRDREWERRRRSRSPLPPRDTERSRSRRRSRTPPPRQRRSRSRNRSPSRNRYRSRRDRSGSRS